VVAYMWHGTLPLNCYGCFNNSILDDKDLGQQIHLHLTGIAKEGYIRAQDVVDVMSTPEMKRYLDTKTGISKWMGQRWLHKMQWWYGKVTKGMYLDGHRWADIVEYCEGFLVCTSLVSFSASEECPHLKSGWAISVNHKSQSWNVELRGGKINNAANDLIHLDSVNISIIARIWMGPNAGFLRKMLVRWCSMIIIVNPVTIIFAIEWKVCQKKLSESQTALAHLLLVFMKSMPEP
jgi:hypothetical protein